MTELSRLTSRQLGAMVDRRGRITHIIVGDAHRLFIPDLKRHRAGEGRFRGLRLLHTHLRGEGLSRDDLTDLTLLKLDAVVVVQAQLDGLPGRVEVGCLDPAAVDGAPQPWTIEKVPSLYGWQTDFRLFIQDLEAQFSRRDAARKIPGAEGVIVIGVTTGDATEAKASLAELHRLAETAGLQVLDQILQVRRRFDPKYVIGKGKLETVLVRAMQLGCEVLAFDQELAPSQLRNIATATDLKVVDRTQLILDIFAQRAASREGRLQVELAQLRYRAPRLKIMPTAMSRLSGGIGGRGPGETKLEINRRRSDERLTRLQKQLKKLSQQRGLRRSRRQRVGLPQVAIVGYTNAGKSTLLNTMTHSKVDAEDKLFATLDPTSRRLRFPEAREVILTDTVGFIRNLPKDLMHAFRATLEEAIEADLLLHVVDASSVEIDTHLREVNQTLETLDSNTIPTLLVLNKIDAVDPSHWRELKERYSGILCSAQTGEGLETLMHTIEHRLFQKAQADRSEP
ncbi:MAG: GTP-binding protein HflX [Myxococcota bacterium]|jgi:GTP-binding protein HflX